MSNQDNCESIGELLSGYIDDELSQQQQQRVMVHVAYCGDCRVLVENMMHMKSTLQQTQRPRLEAHKIDALLNDKVSKTLQLLAWSAILIALSILLAFAVVSFLESDISFAEKLLTSLLWGGGLGLFLSVARQQYKARKTDKYKGVKL